MGEVIWQASDSTLSKELRATNDLRLLSVLFVAKNSIQSIKLTCSKVYTNVYHRIASQLI